MDWKKHQYSVRGFIWRNRAHYKNVILMPSITVGMFGVDEKGHSEGTTGEFLFDWIDIGGRLTPELKAFNDSWSALSSFADLLGEMAAVDGQDITDEQFVAILKRLGIRDLTEYHADFKDEP